MNGKMARRCRAIVGYEVGDPKEDNPAFRKYRSLKRALTRSVVRAHEVPITAQEKAKKAKKA